MATQAKRKRPEWLIKASKKRAKLTDEQREQIRWLVRVNQRELAKHFGVSWCTIQRLQSATKKYGYKGPPVWVKVPKKEWATRKTAPRWAETLAKKQKSKKWVRTVEKFREYIKKPDALHHARINGMKTHCKRRHALTGANVYVQYWRGKVMRRCVTCFKQTQKERNAKIYQKRKADRIRRRRIEAEKRVRKQQERNLWNVKQNRSDERQSGNRKRQTPSRKTEVIFTEVKPEFYCRGHSHRESHYDGAVCTDKARGRLARADLP